MGFWGGLRREVRPLVELAAPLVLGEFGWMCMSLVDTMFAGRVSKEALGAVSVGNMLYATVAVTGIGVLLGLDPLVAQAFGAGDKKDCNRSLVNGLWVAAALTPIFCGLTYLWIPLLPVFGVHPSVMPLAKPYLGALVWSLPPLYLYTALRRYLQGMNQVRIVMMALLSANLINAAANWVLVFGNLGAPALGAEGSGWATTISRVYMAGVLVAYAWWWDKVEDGGLRRVRWLPDAARFTELVRLGLPAAFQIMVEVGVFAVVTTLAGRLRPTDLAAHQVAVGMCSLSFMVPLGLGSAAAVRVGQAIGRGDRKGAGYSGWAAILLAVVVMAGFAALFLSVPRQIGWLFIPDADVGQAAVALLALAGMFQVFDGAQGVATGALRGAGNTGIAAVTHLVSYWVLGLPVGWWLCFRNGSGATGLWVGLCIGVMTIGVALTICWFWMSRRLQTEGLAT